MTNDSGLRPQPTAPAVLDAQQISKTYDDGGKQTEVLKGLTMTVSAGEAVAIVGASGSGKSTLLHVLGGLDMPTSGTVTVAGQRIGGLNETELGELRNRHLGFVYQFHHLLPEFTALENVAMPLLIRKEVSVKSAQAKAKDMIEKVGLGHRLAHKPGMLSGGERQRIALARALVTEPKLLLADEPTGNLDHANAENMFSLLKDLQESMGLAMIIVTHDKTLAARCDRILNLQDGMWV